jgi:TonB family protein
VGSVAGQDDVKIFGEEGVKSPVVLHQEKPSYTEEAVRARVEGIVLLQLVIRKDGKADSFKVIRKLGYGLDESAISTIAHKWRFRAGTYSGSPADVQIKIEVSFMIFPGWDDTLVMYNIIKAQAERGDVAAQMQQVCCICWERALKGILLRRISGLISQQQMAHPVRLSSVTALRKE